MCRVTGVVGNESTDEHAKAGGEPRVSPSTSELQGGKYTPKIIYADELMRRKFKL